MKHFDRLIHDLIFHGGAVVYHSVCSEEEIIEAEKDGRIYKNDDGDTVLRRTKGWLDHVTRLREKEILKEILEETEVEAEIERLEAIVNALPKTADGVPVVPVMTVWSWVDVPYFNGDSEVERKELASYQVGGVGRVTFDVVNQHGVNVGSLAGQNCYSTKAAAETAGGE